MSSAPIYLYGDGNFAISDVKEVKVTEEFLGLDDSTKNCQNREPYENCTTRHYLETVQLKCNCVPYALKDFSKANQVGGCFNV